MLCHNWGTNILLCSDLQGLTRRTRLG